MKKVIVTTTIYNPTEAVRKFDAMPDWQLVVIGDKKTPKDYSLENGIYVTPEMQEDYDKELSDAIGWNCIQRRNFGFLWAKDLNADVIAVIDDDNIPYENWGQDIFLNTPTEANYYSTDLLSFDPIGATNESAYWHRGYPLQLIPQREYDTVEKRAITADIQADFWNGDPDIDAVCRMIFKPECSFDDKCFPIASNKISPFNSQNTFITQKVLPHYFLYPHVGRMDDIWASFYAQAKGLNVIYNKATVYQDRNVHDLTIDMKKEYIGYEHNLNMIEALYNDPEAIRDYLPEQTLKAWDLYKKHFN